MIEMGDTSQPELPVSSQRVEDEKERNRVRAAGYRRNHRRLSGPELVLLCERLHAAWQIHGWLAIGLRSSLVPEGGLEPPT